MSYTPGQISSDPGDLSVYLSDELDKIASAIDQGQFRSLDFLHVAPEKPRDGMVRGADGTDWNPMAQGRGVYAYYGGMWNKLIDVASVTVPDGSITTVKLAAFAVTAPKIADLSITLGKLADLAVTTAKLADDAVSSVKIADLAVTKAKVAALSIDASKLVIASVGAALNPDPNFVDPSAWNLLIGTPTFTTTGTGAVGTTVLRTALSLRNKWLGNQYIPIDPLKVYRVRMLIRNVGTAGGQVKPFVHVLDAAGSTIDGSDNDPATLTTEWFEYATQTIAAGSAWVETIAVFGAASARTFINAAKTMVCGCDANTGAVANARFEFQDARIEEVVNSTLIADGAISTAKIFANAVTAAKIAAHTITAAEIAAATITATEIAALTITASKIVANTITANEIAAATITATQIATDTITATQIAANAITSSELAATSVVAGKIATNAIVAGDGVIANLAIVNAQIANATILGAKIALATITAANIVDATITNAKIGNLEVDSAKIANLTVGTGKLTDLNVTTPKLADNAVTYPVSAFTSGSIAAGISGAWVTIQTVTSVSATSGHIDLWFSFTGNFVNGSSGIGEGAVRLLRNGSQIFHSGTFSFATGTKVPVAASFSESPGIGTFTYDLQTTTITASDNMDATNRSLISQATFK